jgi:hypothetical protein
MYARRVTLTVLLAVLAISAAACTPNIPFLSSFTGASSAQKAVTPASSQAATSAVVAPTPAPAASSGVVLIYASGGGRRRQVPEDPVLGTKKWGTRSDAVSGALGHGVRDDLHQLAVEDTETAKLMDQQADELLEVFEDAAGVHRIIRRYGGDVDDTHFWVKSISANEDQAAIRTPWVTATLRADFPSPEGRRGLEMQVYRIRISDSRLDNTPYVASTQVSYLDSDGELSWDGGYSPNGGNTSMDGLNTIRYRN